MKEQGVGASINYVGRRGGGGNHWLGYVVGKLRLVHTYSYLYVDAPLGVIHKTNHVATLATNGGREFLKNHNTA